MLETEDKTYLSTESPLLIRPILDSDNTELTSQSSFLWKHLSSLPKDLPTGSSDIRQLFHIFCISGGH